MQKFRTDREALPFWQQALLIGLSFLCVAFGQPAWVPWLGYIAAAVGYALFWRAMFCWPSRRVRFLTATAWFTCVQAIQLSWMTSYEYQGKYILLVYFFLVIAMGAQFGMLSILIRRASLAVIWRVAALSSIWVLFEWARLFVLTGFTWNPIGLALTGHAIPMQLASIGGVYGLSFLVIFTNLLILRVWALSDQIKPAYIWLCVAVFPYLFGYGHITFHQWQGADSPTQPVVRAVLVQTAMRPRITAFRDGENPFEYAFGQWERILLFLQKQKQQEQQKQQGEEIDLIVLPETVVPFGSRDLVYSYDAVQEAFCDTFGEASVQMLPQLDSPSSLVSNAFWAQAIANLFDADIVLGLDDQDQYSTESYNAALHFSSKSSKRGSPERYEKQVLMPMAEYIPFSWCRSLAARYGICGSFTAGKRAKVFQGSKTPPFGVSICYEETYGDLIRENRLKGADLLVNVTNDVWFPNSRLPRQHFDHARLRSVENGVPFLRACNTGLTAGVDSLGRIVGFLGDDEWQADSFHLMLPTYTYATLYTYFGDGLIIGFSFILVGLVLRFRLL